MLKKNEKQKKARKNGFHSQTLKLLMNLLFQDVFLPSHQFFFFSIAQKENRLKKIIQLGTIWGPTGNWPYIYEKPT